MRRSRQKAYLLVLIGSIACDSTTGPGTVSEHFVLQTIDGRPLPTYIAATPGGVSTIISSSLTLDKAGKAVVIEHRDEMFRGDVTDTTAYDYSIHGNQIEIGSFSVCLANLVCPTNRIGTISPFGLSLVINPTSSDYHIVFKYRSLGSD
jgi:hypothetical protein